ncbi:hypothetical protein ABIC83_003021 [Roseateles asaccharophilus]|uniref:RES family NAD+ phosphorylase n=1 Tax=Roseateles asaccharophilus TaxID=582607 RepID=UPI0038357E1E
MKLTELENPPAYELTAGLELYRIQRNAIRRGAKKIGPLRLSPPGLLKGRFDLPDDVVGYFAETPETAGYECLARREAVSMSYEEVAQRELLCVTVTRNLKLLDLRALATAWPVLQALRFASTQELAVSVRDAGFAGIIYRSAQQAGMDAMALFGAHLKALRLAWSEPLVEPGTGNLHSLIADIARGAELAVLPPS